MAIVKQRMTRSQALAEQMMMRVRALAEAGARGRELSPIEVKEICEAYRLQSRRASTHFHSGFGA